MLCMMSMPYGAAKRLAWGAVLPAFLLVGACVDKQSESYLRERATAYYERKADEDYAAMYPYLMPRIRKRLDQLTYESGHGAVTYKDFSLLDVQIDGEKAKVKYQMTAFVRHPMLERMGKRNPFRGGKVFEATDLWEFVEGDWYYNYQPQTVTPEKAYQQFGGVNPNVQQ